MGIVIAVCRAKGNAFRRFRHRYRAFGRLAIIGFRGDRHSARADTRNEAGIRVNRRHSLVATGKCDISGLTGGQLRFELRRFADL